MAKQNTLYEQLKHREILAIVATIRSKKFKEDDGSSKASITLVPDLDASINIFVEFGYCQCSEEEMEFAMKELELGTKILYMQGGKHGTDCGLLDPSWKSTPTTDYYARLYTFPEMNVINQRPITKIVESEYDLLFSRHSIHFSQRSTS